MHKVHTNTMRAVLNPIAGEPLNISRETHTKHVHAQQCRVKTRSSIVLKTACRDCRCGLRTWLKFIVGFGRGVKSRIESQKRRKVYVPIVTGMVEIQEVPPTNQAYQQDHQCSELLSCGVCT